MHDIMTVKNEIWDKISVKGNSLFRDIDHYIKGMHLNIAFSPTQVFQWVNIYAGPIYVKEEHNL